MLQFQWPAMLWMAALLPLLVIGYRWLLRRRKEAVVNYPGLGLVRQAAGRPDWRRRVPPLLLLAGLAFLLVAAARPMTSMTLPSDAKTIMLAMDVSGSMSAADVQPDRISASQVAAKAFVRDLPRDVRVGVVAYGGTAQLVQPPTQSRDDVIAAIERFQLQPGTAIGSGLAVALTALFPESAQEILQAGDHRRRARPVRSVGLEEDDQAARGAPKQAPAEPGSYGHAAVVLLTDGQNTTGLDPLEVAQRAADRGVKVFTVGFGTKGGANIEFQGWSMRVQLDEDTLRQIAGLTRGQYFHAGTGQDLSQVYSTLKSRLVMEKRETEITVVFALAAAILVILGSALSTLWFGRVA